MILVVHSLYDLYVDTNDLKFIKDAICLLEYAYNFSSSNHHFKLLLLKLYNKLGKYKFLKLVLNTPVIRKYFLLKVENV